MEPTYHFMVRDWRLPSIKRNPFGRVGVYRGLNKVSTHLKQSRRIKRKQSRANTQHMRRLVR